MAIDTFENTKIVVADILTNTWKIPDFWKTSLHNE